MLIVFLILIAVFAIALKSEIHAVGVWFVLLLTHGLIYQTVGSSAEHMPMLAGLIIVLTIVGRKKWTGVSSQTLLVMVLLCLTMSVAAIAGLEPEDSLVKLLLYWKGFMLALLIAGTIKDDAQIKVLTQYCLAGVTVGLGITFYEYFTGAYAVQVYGMQRAALLYGGPNVSAALLLTGLPIAAYWSTHARRKAVSIACFSLIGLMIAAITFTQSRGGFVAMLLVLLLLYFRKPSVKGLLAGLVIMAIGLPFVPADYWDRISTLGNLEEQSGRSMDLRLHFVRVGTELFLDNPVLGVGVGNFGIAMNAVDPAPGADRNIEWVAHNMYLEFFVENGVFGGLLFVALFGITLLPALRYDKLNKSEHSAYGLGFCVAVSLISIMISGLFLSIGKHSVLWFLVGLTMTFQAASKALKNVSNVPRPEHQLDTPANSTVEANPY